MTSRPARTGRWLHPGAWWTWALGMAAAASRTTNPLLLVLLIVVAAIVVQSRKPQAPWGRSFAFFLRLGLVIIAVRVIVQVLFGASIGQTVLIPLPGLGLPSWLAGIRIGGDVTAESLLLALYDGLRLATIIICIGAANSLASPTRLLKAVPSALYELGVSVVVALTFTPQLIGDVDRLRTTRRLRGRPASGLSALAGSAVPVLEAALERSVALAAAMDSRGYGRRGPQSVRQRRATTALVLGGLVASCIGAYALIGAGTPAVAGVALVVLGASGAVAGTWLAGRTRLRSRYRPDPWSWSEWAVACAGIVVALVFAGLAWLALPGMQAIADPPTWPELPWIAVVGLVIAVTPAWTAPPLPASERSEAPLAEPIPAQAASGGLT